MPDGMSPRSSGARDQFAPDRTERLARAIDRAMIGGPTPVLDDADLQDLLALATRLRDELPRDLPDPAFRDDLKQHLTRGRVEALPPARSARPVNARSRKRTPSLAALSAVAAVVVAVLAAGVVAALLNEEENRGPSNLAVQETATRTLATSSVVVATVSSVAGVPDASFTPDDGSDSGDTAITEPTPAQEDSAPADETPAIAIRTETTTTATAPADTQTPAATTTEQRSLASLPAVEVDTVEQGPVPLAEGASDGPDEAGEVEFILSTQLPSFAQTAPVYRLVPPDVDPAALVADVAARLGIEGEVNVIEHNDYREFHVTSDDERTFRWIPETGAFQYGSLENSVEGELTAEEAIEVVRTWLAGTGYPVDGLDVTGTSEPFDAGQWQVQVGLSGMPQPAVGHPLGVRAFVNDEGVVLSATGYWLIPHAEEQAPLRSAEECLSELQAGAGYWQDGGMSVDGGELSVESIEVTYVLTRGDDGLVLQPAMRADGNFSTADGLSSGQISVYVRAARADS